ncbi:MAG: tRNA (adenosine(37)-N6)-threonylcarbamoyltransferase complex dimerization subunit type 1 TsaB [Planctomycetota bacterium]
MRVLGIETSSDRGGIALSDAENGLILTQELTPGFSHGRELVPGIEALLERAGKGLPDLLACGQGPGSYTGLRIGLAVVRALAFAWDRPALGICSLEAMAAADPRRSGHALVVVDAKKGEVYWALYELGVGRPRCVREPQIGRPWDIGPLPCDTWVVGDGVAVVKTVPQYRDLPADPDRRPRAEDVARLAWQNHLTGVRQDPEILLPMYLRPSEAEIRWSRRRSKARQEP